MNRIYYRLGDLQGTVKPLGCPSSTQFDGVSHLLKISLLSLFMAHRGRKSNRQERRCCRKQKHSVASFTIKLKQSSKAGVCSSHLLPQWSRMSCISELPGSPLSSIWGRDRNMMGWFLQVPTCKDMKLAYGAISEETGLGWGEQST